MLLYVHLPLCVRKCRYCAFVSTEYCAATAEAVVDAVVEDIARWGGMAPVQGRTLYVGGGTPSLWSLSQLGRILDAVHEHMGLEAGAEVCVEANPESALRSGWLQGLRNLGVTRVSLGVQSFHDSLLVFLGRPHDGDTARIAVAHAGDAGLDVSIDLLWNVPGSTVAGWEADVRQAVALGVQHVSCYALTSEPGTPLAADPVAWPDEDVATAQFELACQMLEDSGFIHYELANFGRPGYFCRHNQGYWQGEDYLGWGPGAVSTWQGQRWTNPAGVHGYHLMVRQGEFPQGESISPAVAAREAMVLSLRTASGLDVAAYSRRFGVDVGAWEPLWRRLVAAGLALWDGQRVRLSRRGLLVSNAILAECFTILDGLVPTFQEES
jgi:putative oxygen-independent coproporphyrinogen III oxidase